MMAGGGAPRLWSVSPCPHYPTTLRAATTTTVNNTSTNTTSICSSMEAVAESLCRLCPSDLVQLCDCAHQPHRRVQIRRSQQQQQPPPATTPTVVWLAPQHQQTPPPPVALLSLRQRRRLCSLEELSTAVLLAARAEQLLFCSLVYHLLCAAAIAAASLSHSTVSNRLSAVTLVAAIMCRGVLSRWRLSPLPPWLACLCCKRRPLTQVGVAPASRISHSPVLAPSGSRMSTLIRPSKVFRTELAEIRSTISTIIHTSSRISTTPTTIICTTTSSLTIPTTITPTTIISLSRRQRRWRRRSLSDHRSVPPVLVTAACSGLVNTSCPPPFPRLLL